ncbi:MAG: V-type ATP synthase subunit K [Angelakisella sp.]|jgi:V/A-type H+-transporting ATPase subunit K|nr:V-type ATP synthase subunit K [Angelakisella sp.]MCI9196067.1 V-type ATP synthase subunit K [Angelakisella sp.]MCI9665906.1 V-type ATP synthase subunit K [Angelakisella sp.]
MKEFFEVFNGNFLAYLGVAFAVIFSGIGSAKGVGLVGEAMSGVTVEDPGKFGQLLLLQALPATQGIYGFVVGFMVMVTTGMLGGTVNLSMATGAYIFASCCPIAFVGMVSGIHQGRVSAAGVNIVAKRPEEVSKAMVPAAMVETYAILALLISLLLVLNIH